MDKRTYICSLRSDLSSIFSNIEWNIGALCGMAAIIKCPQIVYLPAAHKRLEIDGLKIDGYQALGVSLLKKDRQARVDELISGAKRSLICDSFEAATEYLAKAIHVRKFNVDPYEEDKCWSSKFSIVWGGSDRSVKQYISKDERLFMSDLISGLRHSIRHNNGKMLPKSELSFDRVVSGSRVSFSQAWVKGDENSLKLRLNTAHGFFSIIRDVSMKCFDGILGGI